jgi:hypothetical protein
MHAKNNYGAESFLKLANRPADFVSESDILSARIDARGTKLPQFLRGRHLIAPVIGVLRVRAAIAARYHYHNVIAELPCPRKSCNGIMGMGIRNCSLVETVGGMVLLEPVRRLSGDRSTADGLTRTTTSSNDRMTIRC